MKKVHAYQAFSGLLIGGLMLLSCQQISKADTESVENNLTYFKDKKTGLCFAAINSMHGGSILETSTSITCVPCDSLKEIGIK